MFQRIFKRWIFDYKKWNLRSYPESKINIGGTEGYYYDNVSEPQMDLYLAKGEAITDKAMIICPGGGLYLLSYLKEGVKLAEKLASNGITAIILKYRTYPRKGSVVKWSQSLFSGFVVGLVVSSCKGLSI